MSSPTDPFLTPPPANPVPRPEAAQGSNAGNQQQPQGNQPQQQQPQGHQPQQQPQHQWPGQGQQPQQQQQFQQQPPQPPQQPPQKPKGPESPLAAWKHVSPENRINFLRLSRLQFGLTALILFATFMPLPWSANAILFGLIGITYGICLCIFGLKIKVPFANVAVAGMGIILSFLLLITPLVTLLNYNSYSTFQSCSDRAITVTATKACSDQLVDSATSWLKNM